MARDFKALRKRVFHFNPDEISVRCIEYKRSQKETFLNVMRELGEKVFSSPDRFPGGHLTVSILITSKDNHMVLVNHHKVDKSLTWFGGHGDGNYDLEEQIITEVGEECGLSPDEFEIWEDSGRFVTAKEFLENPDLTAKIMAVSTFPIAAHMKKGKYVADHIHYDVCFVGRTSIENEVKVKPDENEFVGWKTMSELKFQMKDKRKFKIFQDIMEYMSRFI